MKVWKKWFSLLLSAFIGIIILGTHTVLAANSVTLYTPYTKITVAPGESVDYSVDVINNSDELQTVDLSVSGIPRQWNYNLKSGGLAISQLSILPKEKKSFSLKVEVPFQVNKGSYRFKVNADELGSLPLVITVFEKGTYETAFSSDQLNMEGHSGSTFSFRSKLNNQTAEVQLYALMADVQRGWNVTFKTGGKQVSSVEIEANGNKEINIDINPPAQVEAGKYKIPITAVTNNTSSKLELEVVITGTYNMELTTQTGLLSANITAGEEKKLELMVKNTGSSPLTDIQLSSSAPSNWSVQFNPKKIYRLEPSSSTQVYATIKADKKAIPGDYVTNMEARTPEVTAKASFRIAVKTPLLWGWIGILIILGAFGSVYYLFRKYGRR